MNFLARNSTHYLNTSRSFSFNTDKCKLNESWRKLAEKGKTQQFLYIVADSEKSIFIPFLPLNLKILLVCSCSNPNRTKNVVECLQELFSYLTSSLNSVA